MGLASNNGSLCSSNKRRHGIEEIVANASEGADLEKEGPRQGNAAAIERANGGGGPAAADRRCSLFHHSVSPTPIKQSHGSFFAFSLSRECFVPLPLLCDDASERRQTAAARGLAAPSRGRRRQRRTTTTADQSLLFCFFRSSSNSRGRGRACFVRCCGASSSSWVGVLGFFLGDKKRGRKRGKSVGEPTRVFFLSLGSLALSESLRKALFLDPDDDDARRKLAQSSHHRLFLSLSFPYFAD